MIAIVTELVVHLGIGREHSREPLEPVTRFVEDVGHSVTVRESTRIEAIAKGSGMIAVSHQHHVGGVGGSHHVLQVVRCVCPAACYRHEFAVAGRIVDDDSVVSVDDCLEQRIESRSLLTHVVKESVGGTCIDISPDPNDWRRDAVRRNTIVPGCSDRGEIEPIVNDTRAERFCD